MSLGARIFNVERDYEEICQWWSAHKWPAIPVAALPKLGLVVEDGFHKYCAGWIYFVESNWAWMEWIVSNPRSPIKKRKASLEVLLEELTKIARSAGVLNMLTSVKNKNLSALYEKFGFFKTDTEMTNLLWRPT